MTVKPDLAAGHALPFASTAPWKGSSARLEVIAVIDETADVKTFVFRPEGGGWFSYKPGQFVTLELPVPGGPVWRTYTLSSTPTRPFSASVTVKAQAGSIGTRWMFDTLVPGMTLTASGPAGHFSHWNHLAERYLFLSAGSGITPMMSMLRAMADTAPASDVAFLTCGRTPGDLLFRDELEMLARQMPNLTLGLMVERKSAADRWHGLTGRIDMARLKFLVRDYRQREIFCCGPEPFMAGVRLMLEDAGFDMRHYHEESFGAPSKAQSQVQSQAQILAQTPAPAQATAGTAKPEPVAGADGRVPSQVQGAAPTAAPPAQDGTAPAGYAGDGVRLQFSRSDVTTTCAPGTTLLEAARAAAVRIPAACEAGMCGTCKVKKTAGDVTMEHNGGITDEEIGDGYVLACCSRPLGPVTLEV
ncbi:hybrid-cluster NAD(P)-dependent oxidoreductase [Pannonibacter tanglangensis]|uniref:2Fe-2S iron-sulfur cluster binding domain-containing protein n=1 Tax=Pannonibacter tanglangensis TaxID=2750084 RepID=A0ABW9ZBT7_9HYPH|nr:hybrid-cluster NAD(P)-dependent oxidoreductase [Pannonibacter sp. XCT-34]NBN62277.1 2Fe-2S iron-sulfur cluster binding domain-containing protein [Pannonibacter sp. XCT-34]